MKAIHKGNVYDFILLFQLLFPEISIKLKSRFLIIGISFNGETAFNAIFNIFKMKQNYPEYLANNYAI